MATSSAQRCLRKGSISDAASLLLAGKWKLADIRLANRSAEFYKVKEEDADVYF
jgi:hypothetical protein